MARRGYGLASAIRDIERANIRASAEQARREREKIKREKAFEKQRMLQEKEKAIYYADKLTKEAEEERVIIVSLLNNVHNAKLKVNWDDYKDYSKFKEEVKIIEMPIKPNEEDYKLKFSILNSLIPSIKAKKQEELNNKLSLDLQKWNSECERIKNINSNKNEEWNNRKNKFEAQQNETNNRIDTLRSLYNDGNEEGVEFYFNEVLSKRDYPSYYMLDWEIGYNKENNILIVEYNLPKKSDITNVKQVKYIQTRKEYSETYIKETEINKIYEEGLYQLCLRVNHDIYIMDKLDHIKGIIFNGYLTDVNKSNGKEETKCILSLQTEKSKFMELNLSEVDAKMCFKSLKGVAGAKLCDLVPVAPIANIDNSDRRFVESREIGEKINGYNLASMHWEDFEHLIRELFEKEFSKDGAEVKITQASRDGGVDAIMFDPDPIRGGKYVIQAKRYTNVVGVSAVRDLYGTVLNEGASKGILVTTSDYGADSYEFAKDKPLTLLNGSNLLHMLQKHGYEARIDLKEAKIEINNLK